MSFKRVLILMLALVMSLSMLTACKKNEVEEAGIYNPGEYEGVAKGHAGDIKVKVKVSSDKIESVEIIENNDSDFAIEPAKDVAKAIVEANSTDVDTVSGVTVTTEGVINAVKDALSKAYTNGAPDTGAKDDSEEGKEAKLEDKTTDVVVIGAGGAGLSAAIEVKMNGAEVIVVEKLPLLGGNTKYATGGLNAAETKFQKEKGIEDSVELFVEDTMKGGGNINNKELVEVLAENSAETVDWLTELGTDLTDVGRLGGASVDRAHRPTGGAPVGNHLVEVLAKVAEEKGIEILLDTKAVDIIGDKSEVKGIVVETKNGKYNINAKAVIIATGGFGANNDAVAKFDPELKGYGTTNHPGATGDVLEFAKNIAPSYVDMKEIQTHPTVMPSNNYMITEAVRGNGAILVNREAKRFINEIDTRAAVSDAELAQTGASGFLVFDQGVRESLKAIDGYYNKGFLLEGETIEDLAKALEIDGAQLKTTIETYNGYVAKGSDDDFARPDMPRALETGPYYAVEVAPAVHHTMGGLLINTDAQVIGEAGEPIKGLYAAGEVTGGIHGNNRLGGNALADITVFGRIAGINAAKLSK